MKIIPLKNIEGSATYSQEPSEATLNAVNSMAEKADQMMKNSDKWGQLSDYLKQELTEGKTEFRIAFQDGEKFIIHPIGKNGQTIDLTLNP